MFFILRKCQLPVAVVGSCYFCQDRLTKSSLYLGWTLTLWAKWMRAESPKWTRYCSEHRKNTNPTSHDLLDSDIYIYPELLESCCRIYLCTYHIPSSASSVNYVQPPPPFFPVTGGGDAPGRPTTMIHRIPRSKLSPLGSPMPTVPGYDAFAFMCSFSCVSHLFG